LLHVISDFPKLLKLKADEVLEKDRSKSGYRGWAQGYRLVLQGLAFPEPAPIFAAWRPNNENEANIAMEALLAGDLKVTDVLLGDETQWLRPLPLSLRRGRRMDPLTEAIASRTTVVEGRLVRLSQRDHRTALSTDHSSVGLERVSGQRRRSKWSVRPGQRLALPDLLSHELS
jgi:hypothetical protein